MTLNGLQRNSPDGEQCQGHYQPKQDQASEHHEPHQKRREGEPPSHTAASPSCSRCDLHDTLPAHRVHTGSLDSALEVPTAAENGRLFLWGTDQEFYEITSQSHSIPRGRLAEPEGDLGSTLGVGGAHAGDSLVAFGNR